MGVAVRLGTPAGAGLVHVQRKKRTLCRLKLDGVAAAAGSISASACHLHNLQLNLNDSQSQRTFHTCAPLGFLSLSQECCLN